MDDARIPWLPRADSRNQASVGRFSVIRAAFTEPQFPVKRSREAETALLSGYPSPLRCRFLPSFLPACLPACCSSLPLSSNPNGRDSGNLVHRHDDDDNDDDTSRITSFTLLWLIVSSRLVSSRLASSRRDSCDTSATLQVRR